MYCKTLQICTLCGTEMDALTKYLVCCQRTRWWLPFAKNGRDHAATNGSSACSARVPYMPCKFVIRHIFTYFAREISRIIHDFSASQFSCWFVNGDAAADDTSYSTLDRTYAVNSHGTKVNTHFLICMCFRFKEPHNYTYPPLFPFLLLSTLCFYFGLKWVSSTLSTLL